MGGRSTQTRTRTHRLLATALFVATFVGASSARAVGIGLTAGLYTPTGDAAQLLSSQWQGGVRLLLPPLSPLGVLPVPGLALDLGVDFAMAEGLQRTLEQLPTRQANLTALYRLTIPLGQSFAVYAAAGARINGLWGEMSTQLRDGSLWQHLRGAVVAGGGLDLSLAPGLVLDLRAATGLAGFEAWQADIALILMG